MVAQPSKAGRFVFLDYLRALAAWLVLWDHLGTIMPGWANRTFAPAAWVRANIADPLGVIQNFGWFGVALFFLISGFIITDRARVEGVAEFSLKRLLRIYPMLAIAVVLAAVLVTAPGVATVRAVLLSMTLANYVMVPQVVILGVAWTLVIEMAFYALTAGTQWARNSPHRIALNLAVVALVVSRRGAFGPEFSLFAVSVSYLPVLVMGQALYWWLSARRLSARWAIAYLAAAFALFVWGLRLIQPGFLAPANSYVISVVYALMLFAALIHAPLRENRLVRLLSDTSYALYLLHGVVAPLVLKTLMPHGPLSVAIAAAAAASLAAAWVAHMLVERPLQGLARRLAGGRRARLRAAPAAT